MVSGNTSDQNLYRLWGQAMVELKRRGMWANGSPLGWAAEHLVCHNLNLAPMPTNKKYFDAIGVRPTQRYQFKVRQSTVGSANINGLQDLPGHHFHFLVVVLFEKDYYSVHKAFKMRHSVALDVATSTSGGGNGYGFTLTEDIVGRNDVDDITTELVWPDA